MLVLQQINISTQIAYTFLRETPLQCQLSEIKDIVKYNPNVSRESSLLMRVNSEEENNYLQ
jgi:hypothetical protein